ncbi:hypothetical protein H3H37_15965 [Duganella sp. LX20W]|uniref:Uncharacterized protein n=1 Tax=Rugamonas brunnea TaxID=2758569 RepID=A0A7W2ETX4_9BURK|nr:hypothetical protein [Rugamonas brunnea]MBA5638556.1 hypothetical protein [Rugamonas brunnea]
MKHLALAVALALSHQAFASSSPFVKAELLSNGATLSLQRHDGSQLIAPKFDDQEFFDNPAIASDSSYVGWLALFPDRGASYPQPLYLVILDRFNHVHRFEGKFGMVFGWCFTEDGSSVVYKYSFPHGTTPIAFDMRRIEDEKLLRRFELDPIAPEENEDAVLQSKTPRWARCATKRVRGH